MRRYNENRKFTFDLSIPLCSNDGNMNYGMFLFNFWKEEKFINIKSCKLISFHNIAMVENLNCKFDVLIYYASIEKSKWNLIRNIIQIINFETDSVLR